MRTWAVETITPGETRQLGECLGRFLPAGAVLLLTGDLGAGKTCFVQGLARGLGVPDSEPVTSPSYTLLNIHAGRFPLHHFDLYRLSHPDDLLDLGFDEYLQGDGVTVIEWADRIPGLDREGLRLHLQQGEGERRRIEFEAPGKPYPAILEQLARQWRERGKGA